MKRIQMIIIIASIAPSAKFHTTCFSMSSIVQSSDIGITCIQFSRQRNIGQQTNKGEVSLSLIHNFSTSSEVSILCMIDSYVFYR